MAFLSKRKNGGCWYIRWYDNSGKLHSLSTKCKLKTRADSVFDDWKKGKSKSFNCDIKLSELKSKVLDYVKTNIPRSYDSYRASLTQFLNITGNERVDLITINEIEEFKKVRQKMSSKKRIGSNVSAYTINRDIRTIKSAFDKAVEIGLIERNNLKGARQIKVPKKKLRKRFTPEDKIKIFDNLKNVATFKAATISRYTGMRLNEIINLQLKDIDFYNRKIKISGKDSFEAKTESSERLIPISEELMTYLQQWTGINITDGSIKIFNPDDYLISYDNNHKYAKWYISHKFKTTLEKLNIDGHFHCLRHTFASELIESGVDIETVRGLLGHVKIETTAIYLQALDETKRKAVEKII